MILPKLNELSHETKFLKRENMALKRNTLILKKYHDLLKKDIYELKGSQIFRHVGEHDDRLDEIDEELDDLKAVIEKHSKRIQHCEGLENATEKMQVEDLNARLENHSKRIAQLETLEGAMEKMNIDGNGGDATDEAEWEDATLTE
jgi:chromosome segregation ATPase